MDVRALGLLAVVFVVRIQAQRPAVGLHGDVRLHGVGAVILHPGRQQHQQLLGQDLLAVGAGVVDGLQDRPRDLRLLIDLRGDKTGREREALAALGLPLAGKAQGAERAVSLDSGRQVDGALVRQVVRDALQVAGGNGDLFFAGIGQLHAFLGAAGVACHAAFSRQGSQGAGDMQMIVSVLADDGNLLYGVGHGDIDGSLVDARSHVHRDGVIRNGTGGTGDADGVVAGAGLHIHAARGGGNVQGHGVAAVAGADVQVAGGCDGYLVPVVPGINGHGAVQVFRGHGILAGAGGDRHSGAVGRIGLGSHGIQAVAGVHRRGAAGIGFLGDVDFVVVPVGVNGQGAAVLGGGHGVIAGAGIDVRRLHRFECLRWKQRPWPLPVFRRTWCRSSLHWRLPPPPCRKR